MGLRGLRAKERERKRAIESAHMCSPDAQKVEGSLSLASADSNTGTAGVTLLEAYTSSPCRLIDFQMSRGISAQ